MNYPHEHALPDAPDRHADDRLDSWGEIAAYLRRGVRTVRRWEREQDLPIHRHLHRKSGSVYAFKSELDAWWSSRRPHLDTHEDKSQNKWTLRHWWLLTLVLMVGVVLAVLVNPLSSEKHKTPSTVRALAVLPFDDLSHSSQGNVLAGVMTEELITSLAEVMPLRIVSRDSVMRYKDTVKPLPEIARELNVDAVVKGSVQQVGQRVRITVRLIDARSDRHIWANTYEGDTHDILAFQAETARAITNGIRAALPLGPSR